MRGSRVRNIIVGVNLQTLAVKRDAGRIEIEGIDIVTTANTADNKDGVYDVFDSADDRQLIHVYAFGQDKIGSLAGLLEIEQIIA